MQKRSMLQKVFGSFMNSVKKFSRFEFTSGYNPTFTSFGKDPYVSDVVRSAIDSIARNAAKLKPKHIRSVEDEIRLPRSKLERMLAVRPNPLMNTYDFLYKIVTQLYLKNNAYVLINRDGGQYTGFYPIVANWVDSVEHENELYLKFHLPNGKILTSPYADVIHLRRFFNANDVFGDSNDEALLSVLELIHATNQGIINAIKTSAFVRGILKFTTNLNPDDLKRQKDAFVQDYMGVGNNGGVAATDVKADFTPLNGDPKIIDAKQMSLIETKIYKYFGTNEKIILSNYSEDEWNAFYESEIEPIAIQLSLEFTSKSFSTNEQNHGNEILFEANRLQYASNSTKIEVVTMLMDRGMMSQNQGLEVFNMPPIKGGEKRILSLNFIDADKASEYQLGKNQEKPKKKPKEKPKEDDDEDDNNK